MSKQIVAIWTEEVWAGQFQTRELLVTEASDAHAASIFASSKTNKVSFMRDGAGWIRHVTR